MFEAIRIRKAGYAVRMPHSLFMTRYSHIPSASLPIKQRVEDPQLYCQRLFGLIMPVIDLNALTDAANKAEKRKSVQHAGGAAGSKLQRLSVLASESELKNVSQWCVGKTRVYIRSQLLKNHLDHLRIRYAGIP